MDCCCLDNIFILKQHVWYTILICVSLSLENLGMISSRHNVCERAFVLSSGSLRILLFWFLFIHKYLQLIPTYAFSTTLLSFISVPSADLHMKSWQSWAGDFLNFCECFDLSDYKNIAHLGACVNVSILLLVRTVNGYAYDNVEISVLSFLRMGLLNSFSPNNVGNPFHVIFLY